MGRLIDAERFKRFLQALCKAGAPYDEVIQLLDKEPTAYDVEEVVAELEKLENSKARCRNPVEMGKYQAYKKAINIVRKGGGGMSKSKFTYPKCPCCKSEYQDGIEEYTLMKLVTEGCNNVATVKCKKCNKIFNVSVHITYYGRKGGVDV